MGREGGGCCPRGQGGSQGHSSLELYYSFFIIVYFQTVPILILLDVPFPLQDVYRNSMPASSFQQQKLRVCEVCSAYLGLHDNDRRLADHFGGKLHLGFIEIREKLDKLRVGPAASPPPTPLHTVDST